MTNPKWQERRDELAFEEVQKKRTNIESYQSLVVFDTGAEMFFKAGYDAALTDILKDAEVLVEFVKKVADYSENITNNGIVDIACAPRLAKEALKLWDEKGYGK